MIEVTAIYKAFGDVKAVDGISFTVAPGQIFALLGPNGAGKSTTINMLTTLMQADRGSIRIAGLDVHTQSDQVRAIIGATFQDIVLDRDLTGYEVLDFAGRLYGLGTSERRQRIDELLHMVELHDAAKRLTGTYSGGMKRRLELVRCLMTAPQVLFLDEPTQGLDPLHRTMIWQYIEQLRSQHGMTVVLTTHAMDEAESLADQVGIIDHGHLVAYDTPQSLIAQTGNERIAIETTAALDTYAPPWRTQAWVRSWDVSDGVLYVGVDQGPQRLSEIIQLMSHDGITPQAVRMSRPTLADVFLQVTGRTYRDEVNA